jgi:hypothetical protein
MKCKTANMPMVHQHDSMGLFGVARLLWCGGALALVPRVTLALFALLSRGVADGLDRFRDPKRREKGRYALLHRISASGGPTVTLIFNDTAVPLPPADEPAPTGPGLSLADRTVWDQSAGRKTLTLIDVAPTPKEQGSDVSIV